MQKEHQIVARVYEAKRDMNKADELIRSYSPFIRAEASRHLGFTCTDHDDEFSIAMIAFHEAIRGYARERGAFLAYAGLVIRSRLIDHARSQARHRTGPSLDAPVAEDERPLRESLSDNRDPYEESALREATRQEIAELAAVMASFGTSFTDVAENSPKQERTLNACARAIRHAIDHPELLDELLATKKLPLARLAQGTGVERKTLERHRRYLVAMLIIQTNGYEIVRGHLRRVLGSEEAAR